MIQLPEGARVASFVRGRDTARALGEFTTDEFAEAAGYTIGTARNTLGLLKRIGIIDGGGCGSGGRQTGNYATYRYVAPQATGTELAHRPRRKPPEVEAREKLPAVHRGPATPRAGKRSRLRKEVRELLDLAEDAGWPLKPQKHGTLISTPDGVPVTAIPRTPSDHHSLANCRADLKRAGLPSLCGSEVAA